MAADRAHARRQRVGGLRSPWGAPLLALVWGDVDLDARTLGVPCALVPGWGEVEVGSTKTATFRRDVRPPAPAARALTERCTRQDGHPATMGEHWQERGLILPTGLRTLLDQPTCAGGCVRSPREPGWSVGNRTSCGTAPPGCSPPPRWTLEEVADVLGHTGTRVTSSVYRHRTTPTVEAAVTTIERLFDRPEEL